MLERQPILPGHEAGERAQLLLYQAGNELDGVRRESYLSEAYGLTVEYVGAGLDSEASLDRIDRLESAQQLAFKITYLVGQQRTDWTENLLGLNRGIVGAIKDTDSDDRASNLYFESAGIIDRALENTSSTEQRVELLEEKLDVLFLAGKRAQRAATQTEDDPSSKSVLLRQAFRLYSMALKVAENTPPGISDDKARQFSERGHQVILASVDVAIQRARPKDIAYGYTIASNFSERLAGQSDPEKKLFWLEKCYKERIWAAEHAVKFGDTRHAAVSWSLAAKAVNELLTLITDPRIRRKWLQRALEANNKAGGKWHLLGDRKHASDSMKFAQANFLEIERLKVHLKNI